MGILRMLPRAFVPVAVLALLVAACSGKPATQPDANGKYPRSSPGDTYLDGQLRLAEVTAPGKDGTAATFVVENTTAKDLEDVTVSVRFYLPAAEGELQEYDVEAQQDFSVNVFANSRVTISAVPVNPAAVQSWEIRIEPLVTVADPVSGTEYLEGSLRCVGMERDLTGGTPSVRFEIKNISPGPVEAPQYRVVFRRGGKSVGKPTEWQSASGVIPPGGTTTIVPDLSKIDQDLGGATAVLQLQKFIL